MTDQHEAVLEWVEGCIPANAQAALDFNAGKITSAEMWAIINANSGLSLDAEATLIQRWETKPTKGDTVRKGDRNGVVLFKISDTIHVRWFDTNETDDLDIGEFESNYSSKGGRSLWTLEDV